MCKLCEIHPVYEFTNKRKLCKNCFVKYFEKKFFYTIRKFNMIKRGEIVSVRGKGVKLETLNYLLNLLKQKGIISLGKSNKIAQDSNIDSESFEVLNILINKPLKNLRNILPISNEKSIIIKPLYLFLDEEILLYSQIKKLKKEEKKEVEESIHQFLNKLEKNHPEVKRAIVNSYLQMYY